MSAACNLDCAKCLPSFYDFAVEQPVQVTVSEADDVHVAQITIPQAGTYVPQHSHVYDHLTMLATGAVRVWVEGELVGDFDAPAPVKIPAARKHTFLSLTDNVVFYCIHNVSRSGRVEEIERHDLPGYERPIVVDEGVDGVDVCQERFEPFWRDAQGLIAEHTAEIGPREGVDLDINVDVFRKLDAIGALQILTGRCNGRLTGYLVSIVGPSLENPKLKVATQTAFFSSKDFRGFGWRLQKSAVATARAVGVHEIIFRAGVRGIGARTNVLYRRLGAVPHGELWSLMLGTN